MSDEEFVKFLFNTLLDRSPNNKELLWHIESLKKTSRVAKSNEFAYCDEIVKRTWMMHKDKKHREFQPQTGELKVAVILSGHLRSYEKTYPSIAEKLVLPLNADVFIHTWDKIGKQKIIVSIGPVPQEEDNVDLGLVQKLMPNIRDIKIENNAKFLASCKMKDEVNCPIFGAKRGKNWFGLSALPKYIESQLYSINASWELMEKFSAKNNIKYDLVIKMRSDDAAGSNLPEIDMKLLTNNAIWVPSPPNGQHDHPSCFLCAKGFHEGDHHTDVCDVFAYGNMTAMKHYCNLWNNLESVWSECKKENIKQLRNPLVSSGPVDKNIAVNIWANGASHKVNCFYPERLFRKYLVGWRLVGSDFVRKTIR